MDHKMRILVLCVFIFQVHVIKSQDSLKKCSEVKADLVKINNIMQQIVEIKKNFDKESSPSISTFSDFIAEINEYRLDLLFDGCKKAAQADITKLSEEINGYITKFNAVDDFNKTIIDLTSQYGKNCQDEAKDCPKDLSDKISSTLTSIQNTPKDLTDASDKFEKDKVAERITQNTGTWSKSIFPCVLKDKHDKIITVINSFNDTLKSHNHQVELHEQNLNNTLSSILYEFQYAAQEMKKFDEAHGKHDLTNCTINLNTTARVEEVAKSCYQAFSIIVASFSEYCDKNFTSEYKQIETDINGCKDSKCFDGCLKRVDTLKENVVNVINNYNDRNVSSIINGKVAEAEVKFRNDVNNTLECYLKVIAGSNSGRISSLNVHLFLCYGLFIIFTFFLLETSNI